MNYYINTSISAANIQDNADFTAYQNNKEIVSNKDLLKEASRYLAKSLYFRPYMANNQDLLSNIATILWVADATWDKSYKKSKETWRIDRCNWEIQKFMKESSKSHYQVEDIEPGYISESGCEFEDLIDNTKLTPIEKEIIEKTFIDRNTGSEIATELECSTSYVNQIRKRGLSKIKTTLRREGLFRD